MTPDPNGEYGVRSHLLDGKALRVDGEIQPFRMGGSGDGTGSTIYYDPLDTTFTSPGKTTSDSNLFHELTHVRTNGRGESLGTVVDTSTGQVHGEGVFEIRNSPETYPNRYPSMEERDAVYRENAYRADHRVNLPTRDNYYELPGVEPPDD